MGITLAGSLKQLVLLGAFLVGETVLMKLHLWFITTHGNKNAWERRAAVVLALLPLILVKVRREAGAPSKLRTFRIAWAGPGS